MLVCCRMIFCFESTRVIHFSGGGSSCKGRDYTAVVGVLENFPTVLKATLGNREAVRGVPGLYIAVDNINNSHMISGVYVVVLLRPLRVKVSFAFGPPEIFTVAQIAKRC